MREGTTEFFPEIMLTPYLEAIEPVFKGLKF